MDFGLKKVRSGERNVVASDESRKPSSDILPSQCERRGERVTVGDEDGGCMTSLFKRTFLSRLKSWCFTRRDNDVSPRGPMLSRPRPSLRAVGRFERQCGAASAANASSASGGENVSTYMSGYKRGGEVSPHHRLRTSHVRSGCATNVTACASSSTGCSSFPSIAPSETREDDGMRWWPGRPQPLMEAQSVVPVVINTV